MLLASLSAKIGELVKISTLCPVKAFIVASKVIIKDFPSPVKIFSITPIVGSLYRNNNNAIIWVFLGINLNSISHIFISYYINIFVFK